MTLVEGGGLLVRLDWHADPGEGSALLVEAARQLAAYLDGRLARFDLPFDWGAGLQAQVRRAMLGTIDLGSWVQSAIDELSSLD